MCLFDHKSCVFLSKDIKLKMFVVQKDRSAKQHSAKYKKDQRLANKKTTTAEGLWPVMLVKCY